ncbi:origin recognition complex subunit 5 C-terminus-domain-containing protein [Dendryphion nanum]|uniref:Origin recognition complex subunit 5 C-terminus-domain-containing protein n=1 Tax=Dendryphion nanum TaxID=256645 RepID=A0A9P9DE69_9PLEO|nr:origin recognition complex subunit 5 C-terminus-domain-containing protein [Dendryphion nanum]
MLPDELLDQLNREFPCRESQVRQLTALYSKSLPSPSLLVAHGLTATGKSSIVKRYLQLVQIPHTIISSRECITGRHLLERTTVACLDALDDDGHHMDRRQYARTESLNTLVVHLQEMLDGKEKFVLVFDGVDKQREPPPTLLPALARFGESIPNLSIIFITTLPLSTQLHKPGVPHMHFPAYDRSSLVKILNASPPKIFLTPPTPENFPDYTPDVAAEDDAWLWNRFLGVVWDSLSKHTGRDLVSFRNTSLRLWREFVAPIVDSTFGTRDFARLLINRRHLFQLEDAVLDRIISTENPFPSISTSNGTLIAPPTPSAKTAALAKRKTIQHDLPYYTTHLLIAAYLASYNPSRTDPTYFMSHMDKRKNKRRVHTNGAGIATKSKHRRISRHLLTPSPFSAERLLAIFRALVVDGPVPQVADVYTQIATLTSMRLLVRVGGAGSADLLDAGARWRVNFGFEWVRGLGRVVDIEVGEFLVGGVDG